MIFETRTNDFGVTENGINNNFKSSFKGIFNGDFFKKQSLLSSEDINAIKAYNAEIDRCVSSQTAFYRTMQNASKEAQNIGSAANGGKIAIDGLTKSSKAAELGMKGLAMAGNALASIGISVAIAAVTKVITSAINSEKEISEAINNAFIMLQCIFTTTLLSRRPSMSAITTPVNCPACSKKAPKIINASSSCSDRC